MLTLPILGGEEFLRIVGPDASLAGHAEHSIGGNGRFPVYASH